MHTATRSAIPNPEAAFSPEKLINDLADPNMTLGDVAYLHDLTLENLTLWIVRPDITERLKALTDSIYLRVRLAAINHLATTVNALNTMIGAYIDEERTIPVNPTSIQDREQRRRARETARKAVALLTKLAHLPSQRRKAATPSPLGEGRGGVAEISKQPTAPAAIPTRPHTPTPTPITPRDLHDRAGQAPAATLSLFSLYPFAFGEGLGWDGVPAELCTCLPLNARESESSQRHSDEPGATERRGAAHDV